FFSNCPAHPVTYTLSLHDALPISRLGRELIAGGQKYHAHHVPDEDLTADMYEIACERLNAAGIQQYEISNFARTGFESKHNLKYWTREPYLGFGVDAHSMLHTEGGAIRFCNPDTLEMYVAVHGKSETIVGHAAALEEALFLGLRLNRGVNVNSLSVTFGPSSVAAFSDLIVELVREDLLVNEETIRLTSKGRLLSNEVFERVLAN